MILDGFTHQCEPKPQLLKVSFIIRYLELAFSESQIKVVVADSLDSTFFVLLE